MRPSLPRAVKGRVTRAAVRAVARSKSYVPDFAWPLLLTLRSIPGRGPLVADPSLRRVLVLAAHPDDESLGCSGSMALLRLAGAEVTVVFATDGEATQGADLDPAEIGRRRRVEAVKACRAVGVDDVRFAGLSDGGLPGQVDELAAYLAGAVGSCRPDGIMLPWFLDGHADHMAVGDALAQVQLGAQIEIWGYETWTPLPANRIVDVTRVVAQKEAAIAAHQTAALAFDLSAALGLNRWRSIHGLMGRGYAEAFLVLPVAEWLAARVSGRDMILRAATQADDAGIRAVISAAFPDNPKQREEITAWQYWSNPFGRTCVWVWDDDGRIVATYANYPMPAVLDGRPAIAGNGVDAAVDPSYQGQRLFEPLARALYADSLNHGIAVTLCFINNPFAIKGTTKAGWLEVGQLGVWVLAVDDAWIAQRIHVPRFLASLGRRAVWRTRSGRGGLTAGADVPTGIDDVWAVSGVRTGVVRAQEWWEWRYGGHPDRPYTFLSARSPAGRLTGAAVATVREAFGGRFVYLLELLAADSSAAAAIGRAAAGVAVDAGAAGVALLALPGSAVALRARAAGFRHVPKRFDPKPTSFGAVPNDPAYANLQTLDWSVSWGDLDHL